MFGIVTAVADSIILVLVEGLGKLEYRGYGSIGLAVISDDGIERVCVVGRVAESEGASANTQLGDERHAPQSEYKFAFLQQYLRRE